MEQEAYFKHHNKIKENCKIFKQSKIEDTKANLKLFCVVRDGEFYLPQFVEHYKKIGVDQFVFLCNNSADDTIKILEKYDEVKIIINNLPYKTYFHHFKRFLFEEFGKNIWNIIVDIDEFIDYPFSNLVPFKKIIEFCDLYEYNAITSQMIDLMPNLNITEKRNFIESDVFYSTENEKVENYFDIAQCYNKIANPNIKFRLNGWRDKKFNVGDILLTKHVVVKHDNKVQFIHDHFVENASVADFSILVKHYKFNSNFIEYVKTSVIEKNHYNNSVEYVKYNEYLNSGNFNLYENGMKKIDADDYNLNMDEIAISMKFAMFVFNAINNKGIDKNILNLIFEKLTKNETANQYYLTLQHKLMVKNIEVNNLNSKQNETERATNELKNKLEEITNKKNELNDSLAEIKNERNELKNKVEEMLKEISIIKSSKTFKILNFLNARGK